MLVLGVMADSLPALGQPSVPLRSGHVIDQAAILRPREIEQLEHTLQDFERSQGSQVAVLIVSSLHNEPIERFSRRVAESWKLGRAGVSDGVLLTVAIHDRRMRIEVGSGLETALPNALCQRILAETLKPAFKQRAYYAGIERALASMLTQIAAAGLPPSAASAPKPLAQQIALHNLAVEQAAIPASAEQVGPKTLVPAGALGLNSLLWIWLLKRRGRHLGKGAGVSALTFGALAAFSDLSWLWSGAIALLTGWCLCLFARAVADADGGHTDAFDSSSSSWSSFSSESSSSSSDSGGSSDSSSFSGGGASDSW
jgi:uncharacterized protein